MPISPYAGKNLPEEMLTDILSQEKQLVKDYAGDITESSCQNLRQLLISNMTECSEDQYCVFDEMRTRNMYSCVFLSYTMDALRRFISSRYEKIR